MKETRFIAQNKEKWQESESLLNETVKDPEKLSTLFTQVVDDLSYSRTYYPNRSVRVYLNKIAREYFSIIYSHHKNKKNTFREFWINELPQIVWFCRKPLILSTLIFTLSLAIGVFSAQNDPQFTQTILGPDYVAMTTANIESGDPMAVYKKQHQVDMFLGITLNNLMVAFRTYVFGVFLSIGTVAILLYNGIMVGCFQYFFVERGLFAESALTIWQHGTLEISSIILAGGAGLALGSGLIFPGTYSRLQAFQISAIRSLKLMLGITPIFVFAALIEAFLTRYTEIPDFLRLISILLSLVLVIGYFVIYPWMKANRGFASPLVETKLQPTLDEPVRYDRIKNNAEIIKDAFLVFKKYFNGLVPWIALVSVLVAVAEFFAPTPRVDPKIDSDLWWVSFFGDLYYAMSTPDLFFVFLNSLGTSLILHRVFLIADSDVKNEKPKRLRIKGFLHTFFISAVAIWLIHQLGGWGVLLLVLTYLFFMLVAYSQEANNSNIISAMSETGSLLSQGFGQVFGMQLILYLMTLSFLLVLSAPLLYLNTTVLEWNFAETDSWSKYIVDFIIRFVKIFAFNLVLPLLAVSTGSLYYSLKEIATAEHLKAAIEKIGISKPRFQ